MLALLLLLGLETGCKLSFADAYTANDVFCANQIPHQLLHPISRHRRSTKASLAASRVSKALSKKGSRVSSRSRGMLRAKGSNASSSGTFDSPEVSQAEPRETVVLFPQLLLSYHQQQTPTPTRSSSTTQKVRQGW